VKIAIGTIHRAVCWSDFRIAMDRLKFPPQTQLHKMNVSGTSMHTQRNQVMAGVLQTGCEGVLFVDDDHVFAPDAFLRLLDWNEPFIGGLYATKSEPNATSCLIEHTDDRVGRPDRFRSLELEEITCGGLLPVDVLGMGFTWIRREVIEAVRDYDLPEWLAAVPGRTPDQYKDWFEMREFGTDDVAFCLKARQAGFRGMVDTTLKIPHLAIKAVVIDNDRLITCDPHRAVEIAQKSGVPVLV
jgi:hypothetical protein